jgi:hypothetical protein
VGYFTWAKNIQQGVDGVCETVCKALVKFDDALEISEQTEVWCSQRLAGRWSAEGRLTGYSYATDSAS